MIYEAITVGAWIRNMILKASIEIYTSIIVKEKCYGSWPLYPVPTLPNSGLSIMLQVQAGEIVGSILLVRHTMFLLLLRIAW
jgi:hypothetical protein